MKVVVTYVGSSLLGPLKNAERDINRAHKLDLHVAAYNFGSPLSNFEWTEVDKDLGRADVVFVIHVMDGENASRLLDALKRHQARHRAVVVINCMPQLMRRTRMGRLQFSTGDLEGRANETRQGEKEEEAETRGRQDTLVGYGSLVGRTPDAAWAGQ